MVSAGRSSYAAEDELEPVAEMERRIDNHLLSSAFERLAHCMPATLYYMPQLPHSIACRNYSLLCLPQTVGICSYFSCLGVV